MKEITVHVAFNAATEYYTATSPDLPLLSEADKNVEALFTKVFRAAPEAARLSGLTLPEFNLKFVKT